MMSPASVYRIFKRADGEAPSVRIVVVVMVIAALMLTATGVIRVTRQHEVLRLGLLLSKSSERVRTLREVRRQLELEQAMLTAPERIRGLALQLGMQTVSPDAIRVVVPRVTGGKVATR
jgi:cell division protein FtsL